MFGGFQHFLHVLHDAAFRGLELRGAAVIFKVDQSGRLAGDLRTHEGHERGHFFDLEIGNLFIFIFQSKLLSKNILLVNYH